MTTPILITPGEPAGIGPDITVMLASLRAARYGSAGQPLIVIGDPDLLRGRAKLLGVALDLENGALQVIPVKLAVPVTPGVLDPRNADYVLQTLDLAAKLCLENKAKAVVTGPVNKEVMNQAGIPFTGHTEFFAERAQVKKTVMLFVVDKLKVALVTTHLPLANVPAAVTKENIESTLRILHSELKNKFHIREPRILVCGLNPHAGEGGYLGREEIEVISPVLEQWRSSGHLIQGPLAADTIFTPSILEGADAALAMYHDQALPVVKYAGFGGAVNVTLGLPFVRTSVDHGTAIDAAGTTKADPGSLIAAVELASKLI